MSENRLVLISVLGKYSGMPVMRDLTSRSYCTEVSSYEFSREGRAFLNLRVILFADLLLPFESNFQLSIFGSVIRRIEDLLPLFSDD